MNGVTITNGKVSYAETRKITEFEPKRAEVELAFGIEEGADHDEAIAHVISIAHRHAKHMLDMKAEGVSPASAAAKPATAKAAAKAPKIPATPAADKPAAKPVADASAMDDEPEAPAAAAKAETPEDDGLGDLMGEPEPAKEVTDKELTDATQQCQAKNKNAPAIRKALTDLGVKAPPGRIIDLPQEKRQQYLDRLKEIKPLA